MKRHQKGSPVSEEMRAVQKKRYQDLQGRGLVYKQVWVPEESVKHLQDFCRYLRIKHQRLLPSDSK